MSNMLFGYNATHIHDIFAGNGSIPRSFAEQMIEDGDDPKDLVFRWAGGTIAERFNAFGKGYGIEGVNYQNTDENYLFRMIEFCQTYGASVILVFRLLDDVILKPAFPKWYDQNMYLYNEFVNAGVKVVLVELGNEIPYNGLVHGMPNGNSTTYRTLDKSAAHYKKLYDIYRNALPDTQAVSLSADNEFHNRGKRWNGHLRTFGERNMSLHYYFDKVTGVQYLYDQVGKLIRNFDRSKFDFHMTETNMHCGNNTKVAGYPNEALVDTPVHKMILDHTGPALEYYGFKTHIRHLWASKGFHPQAAYRYAEQFV